MRDLDLGRPVRDLDLVVEGDGIALAREVAARLDGVLREHGRFATATLTLPSGEMVDFASTRRETYAHPGALPAIVAGASIEEDLARRDFTINAMAIALARGRRRIDPYGGGPDLVRGVIRELHDRSFVDDPTRSFRAVRYANRLAFRINPATGRAIAAPAALRSLASVSGDRVRREIRRIFEEPRRGRALARMSALGLARAVEPALRADRSAAGRLDRVEALSGTVAGETTWLCYLLAWMWRAGERQVERVADRLALAGAEGRIFRGWPGTAGRLAGATITGDVSADELVAAAASLPARPRRALLERAAARRVRLTIRGADLVAAGIGAGPAVGAALARTLAARREGRIRERDELAFALAAAGKWQ